VSFVLTIGLALAEIAFVTLAGLASCAVLSWKPRRPATVLVIGLLLVAATACVLTLLPKPAGVAAAWCAIPLAALVVYRKRERLRALPFLARDVLRPAAVSVSTIALAGYMLANDYRAGLLLDADSLVFWGLRGHFIFADGLFAPDFWGVVHPDYPPLLPLLNAHAYFLVGASGELLTVAVACVLALVAFFALGDALARTVGRPWDLVIPLLFVLAPVPVFPVHPRILLAGYAETWSILLVALVCDSDAESRRRPMTGDEGAVLLAISLLKNEGCLIACVYAAVRCALIARGAGRPAAAGAARRFALVLAPSFGWIVLVRAARVGTHYDFFRPPPLSEAASRLAAMLEFYRGLPWVYGLVPVVLAASLLPAARGPTGRRTDPWSLWMVFHAAALYALIVAVVVTFDGLPRLALENSFHRLHWSVLLIALVLAARMASPRIAPASPETRTPEGERSPA
jgi:hypothetical protein